MRARRAVRRALGVAFAAFLLVPGGVASGATPTAQYTARFDATWSASSHPVGFPPNAHWSPLIGGTHDGSVHFWNLGELASTGIKDMAERGLTTPLDLEVGAAIGAGHAGQVILGGSIPVSPGTATATFTVSQSFPLVTLVSMIAPSPDWFVGVSSLSLLQGGDWVEQVVVPLFAYDAGTDSGTFYTAPNQVTNPPQPVAANGAAPFANGTPLGIFKFTRTSPPATATVPAASLGGLAALAVLMLAAGGALVARRVSARA
jgi:hypothetical protein